MAFPLLHDWLSDESWSQPPTGADVLSGYYSSEVRTGSLLTVAEVVRGLLGLGPSCTSRLGVDGVEFSLDDLDVTWGEVASGRAELLGLGPLGVLAAEAPPLVQGMSLLSWAQAVSRCTSLPECGQVETWT